MSRNITNTAQNVSRNDARTNVFNYIEMFYNPKRRYGATALLAALRR